MSDLEKNEDKELAQYELQALKDKAKLLGVDFHPSISADKLRERIQAKLNDQPEVKEDTVTEPVEIKETEGQKRKRLRNEQLALVRINVTCMNPAKAQWDGEILSVGNNAVGTVRRFVPFNTPEGWHVERILYDFMKTRECRIFQVKKEGGRTLKVPKMIREFAIEELPALTEKELAELARRQAMQAGKD